MSLLQITQATNPTCPQSGTCIINGAANRLSWRDAILLKDLPRSVSAPSREVRPLVAALAVFPKWTSSLPRSHVNESIPSRFIDACGASFLATCLSATRLSLYLSIAYDKTYQFRFSSHGLTWYVTPILYI